MRTKFKLFRLLCAAIVLGAVLSACSSKSGNVLEGYDYKGVSLGDDKKSITDVLGEPDDVDEDDGGVYSQLGYVDAEFILKKDKVIVMSIHKDFALPNGVAVDDPLSKAVEAFGAENLLQEPDNPKTVNHLLDESYAITLSFREQDEELSNDSSIDSIMIADAKAMLEARGGDFIEFKKKLLPVVLKERQEAIDVEIKSEPTSRNSTVLETLKGYWQDEDGESYLDFSNSTDTKFELAVCTNGKLESFEGDITLNGSQLLTVILQDPVDSAKSYIENYEVAENGHIIREFPVSQTQELVPSSKDKFSGCSNASKSSEVKYSQDFYGKWTRVNAEEDGSVYIELDDMGRGVLEFRNEGETLSYMIHPVKESEQETIVEYDDDAGVTHTVSMSIQNDLLHLTIDDQSTTTYKRSK